MNNIIIFKFSLMRVLKNKVFQIIFGIFIGLNFLINLIIFSTNKSPTVIVTTMTVLCILNIIFYAYFNISNITENFIQDKSSNIESLMIRKGQKPWKIFVWKLLANRTIAFVYFTIIYLFFLMVAIPQSGGMKNFYLKYSLGLFVLIPVELIFMSFTLLISVLSRSYKITLPFSWILVTFLGLYYLLGTTMFWGISVPAVKDKKNIWNIARQDLIQLSKTNKIVSDLRADYLASQKNRSLYNQIFSYESDDIEIIYQKQSEKETTHKDEVQYLYNYISYMASNSWYSLEIYNKNVQEELVDFLNNYFKGAGIDFEIKINSNALAKLLQVQNEDAYLQDLQKLALEVTSNSAKNQLLENSYLSNSKLTKKVSKELQGVLSAIDFCQLGESCNDFNQEKFNQIFENVVAYYFQFEGWENPDLGNIKDFSTAKKQEWTEKFSLQTQVKYLIYNSDYRPDYFAFIYYLNSIIQDPVITDQVGLWALLSKHQSLINMYNFNPFTNIYVMANNLGTGNFYFDTMVINAQLLSTPGYVIIYQNNAIEEFLDPTVPKQFSLLKEAPAIYAIYGVWIAVSLSFTLIALAWFMKNAYKNGGEH